MVAVSQTMKQAKKPSKPRSQESQETKKAKKPSQRKATAESRAREVVEPIFAEREWSRRPGAGDAQVNGRRAKLLEEEGARRKSIPSKLSTRKPKVGVSTAQRVHIQHCMSKTENRGVNLTISRP